MSQAAEAKQAFQILSPTPIHMAEAVPWEAWKELNESVKQAKLQYEEQKRIETEKKAAEEARIAAEQEEAARVAAEQAEAARVAAEQEAAAQIAAEQESSAQAEAASASAGNGNISAEQELLAALIFCEAGNQPYEGQVAMNRVRSGAYPDSMAEVIYQSGQFTPAMTGWLDTVLAEGSYTDSAMQAAADALSGSSPVGDLLYFDCGGYGYQIGDHYFH